MDHGRLQFKLAGPTCDYCGGPKWPCLSDPCKGLSNHFADIMLRVVSEPERPLLKGGQGRTRGDVLDYGNTIAVVTLILLTVCAWILWRAWL